jgi:hypothetical protein
MLALANRYTVIVVDLRGMGGSVSGELLGNRSLRRSG